MSDQPYVKAFTWKHNTHERQTPMLPVEFETTIPTNEWLQTHALDHAATANGKKENYNIKIMFKIMGR